MTILHSEGFICIEMTSSDCLCISKEVKKSLSAKLCGETAPLSGPNETGSDRNYGFYTWKTWSERRFVSPCSVWFVCLSCSRPCVSAAVSGTAGCSSLSSFYRRAAAALGSHLLNFKPSPKVPPRCHWSLLRLSISGQIAVLNCRTFEGFYSSSSFCLKSLKALRWIPHGRLSWLYTRG